jgi:hypothetical protein
LLAASDVSSFNESPSAVSNKGEEMRGAYGYDKVCTGAGVLTILSSEDAAVDDVSEASIHTSLVTCIAKSDRLELSIANDDSSSGCDNDGSGDAWGREDVGSSYRPTGGDVGFTEVSSLSTESDLSTEIDRAYGLKHAIAEGASAVTTTTASNIIPNSQAATATVVAAQTPARPASSTSVQCRGISTATTSATAAANHATIVPTSNHSGLNRNSSNNKPVPNLSRNTPTATTITTTASPLSMLSDVRRIEPPSAATASHSDDDFMRLSVTNDSESDVTLSVTNDAARDVAIYVANESDISSVTSAACPRGVDCHFLDAESFEKPSKVPGPRVCRSLVSAEG